MTDFSPLNRTERTNTDEADPFLSSLKPNHPQWIAFLILETVFLVFGVYLLAAVIFFTIKTKHDWKTPSYPGSDKVRRFQTYLLFLLITYAFACLFKFGLAQWIYWGPQVSTSREHCAVIATFFQALHCIGTTIYFLFLWLRQHTLQQGRSCFTEPSHVINRFSWALFGIIIVGGIATTIGVFFTNSLDSLLYIPGTNACSRHRVLNSNTIIVFTSYFIVVIMQACILVMFILALRRSSSGIQAATNKRRSTIVCNTSIKRIHVIIKNCSIAAAVSMASNVTVILVYTIATEHLVQLVSAAIWDIDTAINLGSIVFCFSNWKKLLLPWPCFDDRFKIKDDFIRMLTFRKQQTRRSLREEGSKDRTHSQCNVLTVTETSKSKTLQYDL